jgi:uncharacterized membrane protein (DUF485 family)
LSNAFGKKESGRPAGRLVLVPLREPSLGAIVGALAPVPPATLEEHTMEADLARRIAANPKYQELKARRSRFGWLLAILMLIVYYGFILLVAFDKPFLAQRLGAGVTTSGMPIGFGVIVFTIVITGIYVRRANSEYDALSEQVAKEVLK